MSGFFVYDMEVSMWPYILLILTLVLSAVATAILKASDGLTRPFLSVLGIALQLIDYVLFSRVILYINISVAYAVFAAGSVMVSIILGFFMFRERLTVIGYISALMIIGSLIYIHMYGTL